MLGFKRKVFIFAIGALLATYRVLASNNPQPTSGPLCARDHINCYILFFWILTQSPEAYHSTQYERYQYIDSKCC